MPKDEALRRIKELRHEIWNTADVSATAEGWEPNVLDHLDLTADQIEFPCVVRSTPAY